MKTLSVIGCGKVAKTLCKLWAKQSCFEISGILNSTPKSSKEAVSFLGVGDVCSEYSQLPKSDCYLIGTSDDSIAKCAEQLSTSVKLTEETTVFHFSGILPADVLKPNSSAQYQVASIHPIKSFPDPSVAVQDFAGTFCGMEGSPKALEILIPRIEKIGGKPLKIDPAKKPIYHAAAVFCSNYLVTLINVARNCFLEAGIDESMVDQVYSPLLERTVDNLLRSSPAEALTGPIARGDLEVVKTHLKDLDLWDKTVGLVYRELGKSTVNLSRTKGKADNVSLEEIAALLENKA